MRRFSSVWQKKPKKKPMKKFRLVLQKLNTVDIGRPRETVGLERASRVDWGERKRFTTFSADSDEIFKIILDSVCRLSFTYRQHLDRTLESTEGCDAMQYWENIPSTNSVCDNYNWNFFQQTHGEFVARLFFLPFSIILSPRKIECIVKLPRFLVERHSISSTTTHNPREGKKMVEKFLIVFCFCHSTSTFEIAFSPSEFTLLPHPWPRTSGFSCGLITSLTTKEGASQWRVKKQIFHSDHASNTLQLVYTSFTGSDDFENTQNSG